MPTLAELYGNPLLDAANTTGRVARTRKPQEEDEQQEIADPAPMPEINKGIISRTGEAALSGLAMVGNFLDLPGSSVRDVLNLKNPFDQYMTPLSDKNRTSGRDLLRSYGLAGKEDDWSNFGTGIGAEMLLDPLTYTGIGLATRGAGQAAGKAGLTKNVTAKTNQAAKKAAEKAGTKAEKLGWMQARMRATPSVLINEADDPAKAMSDFMKYGGTTDMLDKPVNTLLSFNIPWAQWIPGLRDTKLGKTKEIVSKNALKYPDDLPKIADDTAGGPPPQSPPQAPPPGPVAPQGPVAPVAPIAPVAPLVPVAPVAQAIPPAAPQAIPPAAPPVAPQATIPPQPPVAPPAAPKRGRPKSQPVDPTTYAFDADELIQATKLPKDDEAYEFVSGVVQDAADKFGGTLTLKQAREYIDYARANEGLADDQALALEDVLLRAQEFVPTKKNLKKVGKVAAQTDQLPGQQAVAPLAPPAAPIATTDNVSVPPAAPNVTDNVSVISDVDKKNIDASLTKDKGAKSAYSRFLEDPDGVDDIGFRNDEEVISILTKDMGYSDQVAKSFVEYIKENSRTRAAQSATESYSPLGVLQGTSKSATQVFNEIPESEKAILNAAIRDGVIEEVITKSGKVGYRRTGNLTEWLAKKQTTASATNNVSVTPPAVPYESPTAKASLRLDALSGTMEVQDFSKTEGAPKGAGKAALRDIANNAKEQGASKITGNFSTHAALGALGSEFGRENIRFASKATGEMLDIDFAEAMKDPAKYIATVDIDPPAVPASVVDDGAQASAQAAPRLDIENADISGQNPAIGQIADSATIPGDIAKQPDIAEVSGQSLPGIPTFQREYQAAISEGKNEVGAIHAALSSRLKELGVDLSPKEINDNWYNHHTNALGANATDEQIIKALESSRTGKTTNPDEWWLQKPVTSSTSANQLDAKRKKAIEQIESLEKDAAMFKALGRTAMYRELSDKAFQLRKMVDNNIASQKAFDAEQDMIAAAKNKEQAERLAWKSEPTAKPMSETAMVNKLSDGRWALARMVQETGIWTDGAAMLRLPEKTLQKVKDAITKKAINNPAKLDDGTEIQGRYPNHEPVFDQAKQASSADPANVLGYRNMQYTEKVNKKDKLLDNHSVLLQNERTYSLISGPHHETIQKIFPGATYHFPSGKRLGQYTDSIAIKHNGEMVGVIMPMKIEATDAATKAMIDGASKATKIAPTVANDLPPGAAMAAMNPNPLDSLATKEVFQPVVTDGKLNAPATSINFEAISPKHAIYNQNVLTPLLKAKVLNDGNIAWLQTILAKSDMRNISDDLIGQELTWSRAKAIGIDDVNTVPGAYSNIVKSVFVRKKTDLVHSQPEVLLHETGHAIFRELEKTDPDLYSAAYSAIEEAITSGSEGATLFKYFKMAGKNNEYFTSSPGEAFAQLFANVSAGKVNPDSLPSYLLDAVKKVWQKVMDYARRVIGASEAMDPRLKTIEQLVDYAGGYIPKSERDDILKMLKGEAPVKQTFTAATDVNKMQSNAEWKKTKSGFKSSVGSVAFDGEWWGSFVARNGLTNSSPFGFKSADEAKDWVARRGIHKETVMSESGSPLIVYHGSPDASFSPQSFKPSKADDFPLIGTSFSSDKPTANRYAIDIDARKGAAPNPGVYSANLQGQVISIADLRDLWEATGKKWSDEFSQDITEFAKSKGYSIVDAVGLGDTDEFIVIDTKAIKRASQSPLNPDTNLLKVPLPTLKDRMAQGTEAAKSLAITVGKWVSELPEGIADPISKAIDGGLNVVAAIPGVRKALGLLDYSTMGTITEGGQTQAKLVTEAMETARANTREAITPLVRTVEASGHFDPEVIAKETSQSIEQATEQANRRAMEFRAFVEGIDSAFFNEAEMPQEVHDIAIAVRKMYEDALELEAQKAGIDVAELRDAYAMYTPRSVRQPGKSYSRNPLSGPQWETTFPGQRSRKDFLKNLPAGTMVIDELSLDPTFSGIVNTAPVIAKNLRRTKTFVENVDVDTIAKLRAEMHAKYGPKLIPEYFERMSKLMPPKESTSALDDALAASPRKDWTEAWQEAQEQMALEAEELGKKSEELRKAAKAIKDTDAEKYAELTAQADSLRDSAEELVFNPGKDKRYDAMINFIAGLDPTYVKENSPVFGRNLLHDTMQRIQDGQSAAHVAMGAQRFLAQNLTKGIATTENQSEEFQLFMDNLKIGTPKSYENIIGHMSKASRDEHAKFWDSAVEEIVAKIEEFEASPPTGDKNKLLYTGVKDKQQMRIVRAPDGTIGVETKKFGAEEFDFQPLDELGDGGDMEDTLKSLIKQDIDKKFLEMHSAPKEIFEDMTRWMKPFSEPEAISELRGAVDKFSNIFRANVTAPFPGFHVRNFMSATVQNFIYRASDPNELGPNRYFKPIMNALSLRNGEPIQGISKQLEDFVSTKDIDAYKESQIQQLKRQQVREAQASNRELREADFDKINQLEEQIKAIRAAEPDDAMLDIVASRKIADLVFQYGLIGSKQGQAAEVVGDTTSILKSQLPGLNPQNPLRGQWAAAPPDATIFDIANPMAVDGGISLTGKKINADYFILGRIGRSAGGMVEDTVRIAPFIAYLKQGYSHKAAAAMVNKIQIDYSKLSSFERKYARSVFPFWTFSKATLINTVQDLVQNPGGRQANMIRTANVARDEDAVAPEYIQQSASVPLGELPDGSQRYITGFGLGFEDPAKFAKLASGDLGGTAKELLSRTNPLIKYPMELAFGRSTFYDGPNGPQELSELDPTLGRIRSNIYDAATGEKTERPEPFISRGAEHLFANSPFARYGTFARQATDPRKWAAPTGAALDLLTGVKVKDVSEAAQDSIAMQRAGKLFRELGGRNQEIPFFPAEKMESLNPEDRATVEEIKEMMDTVRERRKLRREIEESKISEAK